MTYRRENGPFANRQALKKVPKMGPKTFEQCAGFLRIAGGTNPLDNTAVHPERYEVAKQLIEARRRAGEGGQIDLRPFVTDEVGLPTLTDILHELEKPTRDPRTQIEEFHFDENVHTIDDLVPGMVLPGIVTNIADFGVFVDIGVHKDGLIHVSQLTDRRIRSPHEVVRLHQQIRIRILDIDRSRQRINLTMKGV